MPSHFAARFLRIGFHLINLEAIQQVHLQADDSAVVTLNGPRKALQQIPVPAPFGRELWDFVHNNLVVVEFGDAVEFGDVAEKPPAQKPKDKGSSGKRKKARAH